MLTRHHVTVDFRHHRIFTATVHDWKLQRTNTLRGLQSQQTAEFTSKNTSQREFLQQP